MAGKDGEGGSVCLVTYTEHRTYEATVIASIIQMPSWIRHLGYTDGTIPEYALPSCQSMVSD